MNNEILITVFTPAYNRAHTLPRTLESLKQQNNKKCLTFHTIDDIVIKVVKTTHRKVGIHLTSARASDPGLYLSYIANSLCPWIGG